MVSVWFWKGVIHPLTDELEKVLTYIHPFDILRFGRHDVLLIIEHRNTPRRRNVGRALVKGCRGCLSNRGRVLEIGRHGQKEAKKGVQ